MLKQRNEFGESKLSETERALQMANQIAEEKMNKYKEEKEA